MYYYINAPYPIKIVLLYCKTNPNQNSYGLFRHSFFSKSPMCLQGFFPVFSPFPWQLVKLKNGILEPLGKALFIKKKPGIRLCNPLSDFCELGEYFMDNLKTFYKSIFYRAFSTDPLH